MNEDSASGLNAPLGKFARSLPQQLADLVLDEIIAERLAPGERLKEDALSQSHGVSRATVREALSLLEKQGHVIRTPRSGAKVAEYSFQDVSELFEIRAALLGVAAYRCAGSENKSNADMLKVYVQDLQKLVAGAATAPKQFAQISFRAQSLIVDWAGNRHLVGLYERLAQFGTWQLIRGRALSFLSKKDRRQSADDWRHLADNICAGHPDESEAAARSLLLHSSGRVRSNLREIIKAPQSKA